MKVFVSSAVRALALCLSLLGTFSCTRDQQLVSITIIPDTETFGAGTIPVSADAGLSVQLRALGHYIHPPVTKDITNEVQWGSNDIQMITVNSTGLITATGLSCGGTIVSATVNTNHSAGNRPSAGAIVTSDMNANVVCFSGGSGGSSAALGVNILGTGTGTVVSSPLGITCPTTCIANFMIGSTVTLTATPTGTSTTTNWVSGCSSIPTPNTCTVDLIANTIVTVTFS